MVINVTNDCMYRGTRMKRGDVVKDVPDRDTEWFRQANVGVLVEEADKTPEEIPEEGGEQDGSETDNAGAGKKAHKGRR